MQIMKTHKTLDRLDQLIESRSILMHPFYVAWRNGELTGEQLATYAQVYYPHVAAFPGYLESAIESAEDEFVRFELEDNLEDELHNPKSHPELWLDFAESLGLERESVKNTALRPAAQNIVDTFDRLTGNGSAGALAALYAYESQQPEVSRQKADGLRQLYGVSSPKALAYFEVHAETDIEHRQGERQVLERCLGNSASAEQVLTSASQALDAYWGLLDGICEEAGIPTN
jgi:pyrroloquinoline-quinone synthase